MTLQVAVYVTFHEYTFLISAEKVQSKSKGDIRKFHLAPTQCQISWQRIAYFRAYLATNLKALLRLFWKAEKMGISLRLLSNQLSIFKITWLCSIAEPSLEATPPPRSPLILGTIKEARKKIDNLLFFAPEIKILHKTNFLQRLHNFLAEQNQHRNQFYYFFIRNFIL